VWLGRQLRTTGAEPTAPDSDSSVAVAGKGSEESGQDAAKQSDIEEEPERSQPRLERADTCDWGEIPRSG
jgi:hypothetical protein